MRMMRTLSWIGLAAGAYYVYQNFVKQRSMVHDERQVGRATPTTTSTPTM